MKSQEREPTKNALKPSCDVFDRLGRNRDEDMHTHLEARRNSMTSRRKEDLLIVCPINNEINELRARLEKLAARNTEVAPSTSTSSFSVEIQQAPLPARFRMPTMVTYEGKIDPQDHLDAFNDQMDLLQVTTLPTVDVLQSHCQGQRRSGSDRSNQRSSSPRDSSLPCSCVSSRGHVSVSLP